MTQEKKRIVTRLSAAGNFHLTCLVRDEYAASGKTDTDFATLAAERLGHPISSSSVATARETLGIANNRDLAREAAKVPASDSRVFELEARVAALETSMLIIKAFAQKVGPTSELHGLQFRLGSAA